MADVGDVVIQGGDTIANHDRIAAAARTVAARGALLVAFGGDHSISFPLGCGLEALGPFDVVHVDAHADFLDELDGARLSGASQLRRLAELPFVDSVSALGLRNVDRSEIDGLRALGGRWATTRDVVERGPSRVVADTVRAGAALYVTVDLDVLDTSVAPGHSLPEPGGLGYAELRALLAEIARRGRAVAVDVVELNPARDPSGAHRPRGRVDGRAPPERDPRLSGASPREQAARAGDHGRVDHLPVDGDGPAAGGARGLGGVDHAPRPGELVGGRREGVMDDRELAGVDARLRREAEGLRRDRLGPQRGLVAEREAGTVDRPGSLAAAASSTRALRAWSSSRPSGPGVTPSSAPRSTTPSMTATTRGCAVTSNAARSLAGGLDQCDDRRSAGVERVDRPGKARRARPSAPRRRRGRGRRARRGRPRRGACRGR